MTSVNDYKSFSILILIWNEFRFERKKKKTTVKIKEKQNSY